MQAKLCPVESRRDWLHRIVFHSDTLAGRRFDVALLLVIAASVALVMLESVRPFRMQHHAELKAAEVCITFLFCVEYAVRCALSRPAARYACSFFGIVDALAVLPTLLLELFPTDAHTPLRAIRVVRVLRLLRVFRILRFPGLSHEADVLWGALWAARRKVVIFLVTFLSLVTLMGTVMYIIEDASAGFTSIPRSVYWAVVTLSTVGYGDIQPQSVLGQAVACLCMVLGYSTLAVPTIIASAALAPSRPWRRPRPRATRSAVLGDPRAIEGVSMVSATATESDEDEGGPRTCGGCTMAGHDDDAAHCKFCGALLLELREGGEEGFLFERA